MKRIVNLVFLAALFVTLLSMSLNPGGRAGHTGSPGEQTCAKAGCHDTYALNTSTGSVVINGVGLENNTYVPGQTYTIQVVVSYAGRSLFGLGFEALLSSGANAGNLTAGTGTQTMNFTVGANSRRNIVQTTNGGATANSHTFSFTWVAPAAGAGTVGLYVAGLCANGNGGDTGDYVYTTSRTLTPLVAPTAPTITAAGNTTICSGSSVTLSVTGEAGVTYTWKNANNVTVGSGTSFSATATGCYTVTATNAAGSVNSSNNICVTVSTPNAAFTGLPSTVCADAASISLTPASAGGTFSGNGISGSNFNPATAGVGSQTITYSYTDANNCTATSSNTVVVSARLDASFAPLSADYCANASAVVLQPTTAGGSFSGSGVSGASFNPATAGVGAQTITYTINNNGCVSTTTQNTTVREVPNPSWAIPTLNFCATESSVALTPVNAGGIFSGTGVSGSTFSPSAAGAGSYAITYTLSNAFNCTASQSANVTVDAPLDASFTGLQPAYCANDAPVTVVTTVQGGSLTGPGLNGTVFSPATVGSGVATITYALSNGACFTSTQQQVTVRPTPNASFTGLQPFYCSNAGASALVPTVSGGTFSGDGVSGNSFDPSLAGTGSFVITYDVTSEFNCSASSSQNVTVASTANSDFTGFENGFCTQAPSSLLTPVTVGGTFSGEIVTALGELLLANAAPGTYTVVYTISSGDCGSSTSHDVVVNGLPNAAYANLESSYCGNANAVSLVPQVAGGVFTVDGVVVEAFVPAEVGAGEHTLTHAITDANGCQNSSGQSITILPVPLADVTLSNGVLSALAQDNAAYQWFECVLGQAIPGATSVSFTPTVTGIYNAQITINGCVASTACTNVIVIGVDELDGAVRLYPNPASDVMWVELTETSQLSICDVQGREVMRRNATPGRHELNVAQLKDGWYVVKVVNARGTHSTPVIVHH